MWSIKWLWGQVTAGPVLSISSYLFSSCPPAPLDKTPHRGSITERTHCPQARTELPFFNKKAKGIPYGGCCSDEKAFHPAVFRVSTGCVNYRARGCTLSFLRSCRLLRKSRVSDSHDTDRRRKKHAQIHTDTHTHMPSSRTHARTHTLLCERAAEPVIQPLGDIPVCFQQLQPLTHTHTHQQQL